MYDKNSSLITNPQHDSPWDSFSILLSAKENPSTNGRYANAFLSIPVNSLLSNLISPTGLSHWKLEYEYHYKDSTWNLHLHVTHMGSTALIMSLNSITWIRFTFFGHSTSSSKSFLLVVWQVIDSKILLPPTFLHTQMLHNSSPAKAALTSSKKTAAALNMFIIIRCSRSSTLYWRKGELFVVNEVLIGVLLPDKTRWIKRYQASYLERGRWVNSPNGR